MNAGIRELLYPFGFMASFFFALRFFVQWFLSEKKGKSHVTEIFWKLSIIGSSIFMLHGFIQVQAHLSLIQACNIVISWRNLNIMSDKKEPSPLSKVFVIFGIAITAVIAVFIAQGLFSGGGISWIRRPQTPWNYGSDVNLIWHVIGSCGMAIFASRFWIQWWNAERANKSALNISFWYLSLSGAVLAVAYFVALGDIINILGYSIGIAPYLRNLILLKKEKAGIGYVNE
ncbi:MAG: hypothetical protein HN411_06785 [Waddliaceae bacterium]|jgi:lipid-A-disaccharide synthase-like uncharacterized protein|nr:hypothetical protein [Waddliaceae bacterium]MBT3578413.1 hypothetical protein [Waddliaceae bacterium]MBT4445265.1 hypothetical protein [Waddliaceae bacterium]MBT6929137.1 hypothetical protein [Waddliaceae bacterium]MBT7264636.1 hypothetical protein [Waddliaceae bacterium]